jgi:hypothetical protein
MFVAVSGNPLGFNEWSPRNRPDCAAGVAAQDFATEDPSWPQDGCRISLLQNYVFTAEGTENTERNPIKTVNFSTPSAVSFCLLQEAQMTHFILRWALKEQGTG